MHALDDARVRPLAGGFSGSLLLLAEGWKGAAHTEPVVLKVDTFAQMRRELDGYYQVKDLFGKNVPTFSYPVVAGNRLGVAMELAAMEGRPETLQDAFEQADTEEALDRFTRRLEKTLALLSDKLYLNTRETSWVTPYRAFGLHTERQLRWLRDNSQLVVDYCGDAVPDAGRLDPARLEKMLRLIATNEDGVDAEICLTHGDLNLANVIYDAGDNIWFIDWTHCDLAPLELDFAKLESDVKFVMSKDFGFEDLSRLKKFEEYLLSARVPADVANLPDTLRFVKWDLRFRKILSTVTRVRQACFALKADEDWVVYRIALLRYALHTLSFDKKRGRGECDVPQLVHALYSVDTLVFNLVMDDFHLRIRTERPAAYPPRQRIGIDEAPWMLECPEYAPPYYVDPAVLAADHTRTSGGWADPEDFGEANTTRRLQPTEHQDEEGRPLNPRGRTGLRGRGLLGKWGANVAVAAVVTKPGAEPGTLDVLLGRRAAVPGLDLPKGFVQPGETADAAMSRILLTEVGWVPPESGDVIVEGYAYDARQTDHAWVELEAHLVYCDDDATPRTFSPGGDFEEAEWHPLTAETVNRLPSDQARIMREAVTKLEAADRLGNVQAGELLERTG